MKFCKTLLHCALMATVLAAGSLFAAPLGTAFTYQGRLDQNNQPAPNGIYQMTFSLYTASSGGNPLASNTVPSIVVTNGLFTVDVDFGSTPAWFTGDERWMAIYVRTNDNALPFTLLTPRTRLAPTPNAIFASTAGTVTNGAIRADQLAAGTPAMGQVLGYNGSSLVWQPPGVPGGLTLPYAGIAPSGNPVFQVTNSGSGASADGIVGATASSASQVSAVRGIATSPSGVVVGVYGRATNSPDGTGIVGYGAATGGYFTATRVGGNAGFFDGNVIVNTGNVGIGTTAPSEKLHVNGAYVRVEGLGGEQAYFGGDGAANDVQLGSLNPSVADVSLWNVPNGQFMDLHARDVFARAAYFQGNASVCTLTIRGGCDLAEPFPMKEETIEKGSVVVIDDEHPGQLKQSASAYDTRVAGIVSGANGIYPGIALKQEGVLDRGENVALTGRVYVKADAAFGAIKPGDLLTTSDTLGHAMKVTDSARAQGAILGKAMSALAEGKGLVLVLVTLQ